MSLSVIITFYLVLMNPFGESLNPDFKIREQIFSQNLQADQRVIKKKSGRKRTNCRRKCCRRRKTNAKCEDKKIVKKSTKTSKQSSPTKDKTDGEMKKAGEFKGDLRDLPKTKPADQERPKVKESPDKPIPAPTPKVKSPE